jgi:beta-glucosidase
MWLWVISILSALLALSLSLVLFLRNRHPEPHYNWENIEIDSISFSKKFLWGTATAAHQVEGDLSNNWSDFEVKKKLERSGVACDHWNRWRDDFQMLSDLGLTTYRFSIEWSRLEPKQGAWNDDALDEYSAMVDNLLERGIRPVVTLHHFSHPIWWEEKGGFANQNNISLFMAYCERVFDSLSDRVKVWCTINEPTVFSTMGYTLGQFPPGKRSIRLTMKVMKNMMRAHGSVYHLLKEKQPDVEIGLAKNVTLFDPLNRWSPIDWIVARILDYLWNGAWRNGIMKGKMLGAKIPEAKGAVDFIGLNYYTHFLTGLFMPTSTEELEFAKRKHEITTEFGYPMYAEGFRRAIEFISPLSVPIEITENGVADENDTLRPLHLKRHLWILSEAIKDGFDIRSYHHWSLMDNFEWAEGYKMKFGLYSIDFETQIRYLRDSGVIYQKIIQAED